MLRRLERIRVATTDRVRRVTNETPDNEAGSAEQPTSVPMSLPTRHAMRFVVLLGVVSLFADMTYEGARSVAGPFLGLLGASATVIGIVSGLGELVGYGLRYISGALSDRTQRYWTITLIGYVLNLLAVPLLALAGRWEIAAALLVLERTGKAIRTPARDAMLSHASHSIGRGWGFGLHEAMDQTGALIGPLIVAGILAMHGQYHIAFAWLTVPALLSLATLLIARRTYPNPEELEIATRLRPVTNETRWFWVYTIGGALIALGYADYPLMAFRLAREGVMSAATIPVVYALAMVAEGATGLAFGKLFDRVGLGVVVIGVVVSAAFAPLVFLAPRGLAIAGIALWGIGLGVQGSILRAGLAALAPMEKRGSAYGLFDTVFGVAWFAGSSLMGVLYDRAVVALVVFAVAAQLTSVPFLLAVARFDRRQHA